jgi:hypothetical protein
MSPLYIEIFYKVFVPRLRRSMPAARLASFFSGKNGSLLTRR